MQTIKTAHLMVLSTAQAQSVQGATYGSNPNTPQGRDLRDDPHGL